jgi:hypothetical protein
MGPVVNLVEALDTAYPYRCRCRCLCQLIDVEEKPFRNSIPFLFLVVPMNV